MSILAQGPEDPASFFSPDSLPSSSEVFDSVSFSSSSFSCLKQEMFFHDAQIIHFLNIFFLSRDQNHTDKRELQ